MTDASSIDIRRATADDSSAVVAIILPTIREGSTYALDRTLGESDAMAYWCSPDKATSVATMNDQLVSTIYLRPNQAGGGRRVCNCGYMTDGKATGRVVARRMCLHSLAHARSRGYRAMQFDLVVSTNERAVRLWESLGFAAVGRLAGAFEHPSRGWVDALVMYQVLRDC